MSDDNGTNKVFYTYSNDKSKVTIVKLGDKFFERKSEKGTIGSLLYDVEFEFEKRNDVNLFLFLTSSIPQRMTAKYISEKMGFIY